ncbi:peptide chain release factor N(5)-glutamine methyltransferase [Cognatilysobacter lacus]|uniref:Release factor glutamine methyltransferase n=1 Tax=Cognatilysobacter lacus TaxID=1643323 RepID=A0A5D8Z869_9GAMM|nr:peptide chain release factor N(5)-glutamine methyltransferase [Lysobacter lacus]TZF90746.1 peptide chain release factor N(5)-glutamine methyltransferase [Lysobacter lacus]
MRIDALLREARTRLDGREGEHLLAHVLGRTPAWLLAHGDAVPEPAVIHRFQDLVARREAGEPVAYLTGRRGFWTFDLEVGPAVLIPRPETELLVELALQRAPGGRSDIADLGTGSGAIALALATGRPEARVVATDASAAALDIARGNATRLQLRNITFVEGDWFAPLGNARFDLVVSNPPYIPERDPHLEQGDLRHEPSSALVSGADGLDAIRMLAAGAPNHLRAGGWLLVEHGYDQGDAVRALFIGAGLCEVSSARDLEHRDRVTLGRLG